MAFKIGSLPVQCYRVAVGLTRSLSKGALKKKNDVVVTFIREF